MSAELEIVKSYGKQRAVNFRVSDRMYKQLELIAEKEEISISAVIRQIVSFGLKRISDNKKRKKKNP
jgi:hypothetical protein